MSSLASHTNSNRLPTMPSGLSQEDQQELSALAISLRIHFENLQQTNVQIAWVTYRMCQIIHDATEAQDFFCQVAAKSVATFRYYRSVGKMVNRHFIHPDGHIPMHIARLPLEAFKLLDESTDIHVIQSIEEEAAKGPLSLPQVRQIVEQATAELRSELEEANARIGELAASTAEAQANAKDAESERAAVQAKHDAVVVELRSAERLAKDVQGDRDAVLRDLRDVVEEVEQLRQRETVVTVVEKPVEVLPKDIESLEHARSELAEVTARRERLTLELAEIDQKITLVRTAEDSLEKLERGVADLLASFPAAVALGMREAHGSISARTNQIAQQLRALADTLSANKPD